MRYRHTHIGRVALVCLAAAAGFALPAALVSGVSAAGWVVLGVLAVALLLVGRPTGSVDRLDAAATRRRSRRRLAGVACLAALAPAGVGALLWGESRPVQARLEGDRLSVSSFLYSDALGLSEIEAAGLCDSLPTIAARTNGTALGDLLRGSFELEDGTRARVYLDRSRPPFVAVRHAGGLLLFQADGPDATRALFARLETALDGG